MVPAPDSCHWSLTGFTGQNTITQNKVLQLEIQNIYKYLKSSVLPGNQIFNKAVSTA